MPPASGTTPFRPPLRFRMACAPAAPPACLAALTRPCANLTHMLAGLAGIPDLPFRGRSHPTVPADPDAAKRQPGARLIKHRHSVSASPLRATATQMGAQTSALTTIGWRGDRCSVTAEPREGPVAGSLSRRCGGCGGTAAGRCAPKVPHRMWVYAFMASTAASNLSQARFAHGWFALLQERRLREGCLGHLGGCRVSCGDACSISGGCRMRFG
jgi:hypothetical protein